MVWRRNDFRGYRAGRGYGNSAATREYHWWNRDGRRLQTTSFIEGCAERRRSALQYFGIHRRQSDRRDVRRGERTARDGGRSETNRSRFFRKERYCATNQLRFT